MNKYGFENFIIEQIDEFDNEQEALKAETEYIHKYNSIDSKIGYNLTAGGEGSSGFKHTEETKAKISELKKIYILENKEKFDELNSKQCSLTVEQCLEIQEKYIEKMNIKQLSKKYLCSEKTIRKIIKGTYFNVKNNYIITNEIIKIRSKEDLGKGRINEYNFTLEQEKQVIEKCQNNSMIKEISKELCMSISDIRRILRKNKIKIKFRLGPTKNASKHNANELSEQDIITIRKDYSSGQYSYSDLMKKFNVSKNRIARIIQGKTYKWID
jgi:Mor family transcriptional regulator